MIMYFLSTQDPPSNKEYMLGIYNEYKGLMFSTAYKYISDADAVEDIIQESLVRLMAKIDTVRLLRKCVVTSYIVSTVRNVAINYLKKQSSIKNYQIAEQDEMLAGLAEQRLPLDDLLIAREASGQLIKIWPKLPVDDRILLEGKYILGYTDSELARQIGCAPSSVRMKLTRARRKAWFLLCQGDEVSIDENA